MSGFDAKALQTDPEGMAFLRAVFDSAPDPDHVRPPALTNSAGARLGAKRRKACEPKSWRVSAPAGVQD